MSRVGLRLSLLLLVFFALPLAAQQTSMQPIVQTEIESTEALPGQAISVRITLLVPTFLPRAPVWPSYETPNLLVRVASTGPVSARIDGTTWSGVSRRYLLTPMLPGAIELPRQDVVVTWADPESVAPRQTSLAVEPFTIVGVVPEGAEDLDPFIAADSLTLDQVIEGAPDRLTPGDALSRTVTATVEGVSPMFVPSLIPAQSIEGLRAYVDEPRFAAESQRDRTSGSRSERVAFVAEGGGSGQLAPIRIDWYNLQQGTVETAVLPGIDVSIEGPPATGLEAGRIEGRRIAVLVVGLVLIGYIALRALRRFGPRVRQCAVRLHEDWRASEVFAWRALQRIVRARDLVHLRPALDRWSDRVRGADPRKDGRLKSALLALGKMSYGAQPCGESEAWSALADALTSARHRARRNVSVGPLPPLNPGA